MKKRIWIMSCFLFMLAMLAIYPLRGSVVRSVNMSTADSLTRISSVDSMQIFDSLANKKYEASLSISNYFVKAVAPKDYVNIRDNAVILVMPDSAQIADMK